MYTDIMRKFGETFKKSLEEGKEVSLLAKAKNFPIYYKVKEYTCLLTGIGEYERNPEMNTLTLLFADGKQLTTVAYIDDTIKENSLVVIAGYINKFNNQLQFNCRCGIEKVFFTISDIADYAYELDLNKPHRIGAIINLSVAEESKQYKASSNILPFEDTKLYYIEEDYKISAPKVNLDKIGLINLIASSPTVTKEYPDYEEPYDPIVDIEDLEDKTNNQN